MLGVTLVCSGVGSPDCLCIVAPCGGIDWAPLCPGWPSALLVGSSSQTMLVFALGGRFGEGNDQRMIACGDVVGTSYVIGKR